MTGKCTVCNSEHRASVELGLVHGLSQQVLADRFGLSRDAIGRHARTHLTPQAAAAILMAARPTAIDLDALTEQEGSGLLANLVCQRARLSQYAQQAAEKGETAAAIACERVIATNLEITGKLLSKFVLRSEHRYTSITLTPDYLEFRQLLISTLRRFPEAAKAVAEALAQIENKAADGISTKAGPPMIEARPC
jgi:hypothetical protein